MTSKLNFALAVERPDLLSPKVAALIGADLQNFAQDIRVAAIDPTLADTAAFCEEYGWTLENSANCVVIAAKRGDEVKLAACVVLATMRLDVNGLVRKKLDARKASFAPMDEAVGQTGMEYGGITPIGLPESWPLLIDSHVIERDQVVIGSGIRGSKLFLPGSVLKHLPNAEIVPDLSKLP